MVTRRTTCFLLFFGLAFSGLAQESLEVTGIRSGMLGRYLTEFARQSWEERAAKVARISTPAEVSERQEHIRRTVLEALGGFPEKTPLNPRVTGTLERDGYRVENVIYESIPGYYVTANVYVPASAKPPYPALLGTAGHSANGKASAVYQHVWISLAKRGILVLAYDPQGQGERYQYFDVELGRPRLGSTAEHTMAGIQCLLTGTNVARYELWDGIRGVDYLLSRGDVDPERIGVAGNSGGGTQTAYLAVVEPRLAVAAPACYITSWEKLWAGPGPQDAEQNFAGFLRDGLDFGDFLIAFAPRPLKVLTAIRDFFPIDGARATFAEARRIYEVLGAADRIDFFEYDDGHGWSKPRREAAYRWLEKWLNNRDDEGVEPEFLTEPEENLYATPTGQLATSLKGETVHSLNLALAEDIYPGRSATKIAAPAALRSLVAARIALSAGASSRGGSPAWTKHGEVGRDGYRIEKIALETEKGITIPALVFVPAAGQGRRPAILYVQPAGKSADAGRGGDIEALVRTGNVVMAPDPRGWGESAGRRGSAGYRGSWQTAMRAILVGKTMAGMQTGDLLRSFDYLASREDVDSSSVSLFGKGNGGVLALYAAALEPRFRKVACEGAVTSYMDVVRSKLHEGIMDIVVPGVLRDFDLPDLAFMIAPRPLWIVDPRTPTGGPVNLQKASEHYTDARTAYQSVSKPDNFRVARRPEGWRLEKVYEGWLGSDQ
jgi:cephalosporin-C deacetylase-like acetyl esterase